MLLSFLYGLSVVRQSYVYYSCPSSGCWVKINLMHPCPTIFDFEAWYLLTELSGIDLFMADVEALETYLNYFYCISKRWTKPLPETYDPEQVSEYFKLRPHVVALRLLEVIEIIYYDTSLWFLFIISVQSVKFWLMVNNLLGFCHTISPTKFGHKLSCIKCPIFRKDMLQIHAETQFRNLVGAIWHEVEVIAFGSVFGTRGTYPRVFSSLDLKIYVYTSCHLINSVYLQNK